MFTNTRSVSKATHNLTYRMVQKIKLQFSDSVKVCLITTLLQIFHRMRQWKNFENRSITGTDMNNSVWLTIWTKARVSAEVQNLFVYRKLVKRLCRTAAATVQRAAKTTFFFAAMRLSFSCWIRHFSCDAPIDRSTIWRILVHAALNDSCSAGKLWPVKVEMTFGCRPRYAGSPSTTCDGGRLSKNWRSSSDHAAAVLSCVLPDKPVTMWRTRPWKSVTYWTLMLSQDFPCRPQK